MPSHCAFKSKGKYCLERACDRVHTIGHAVQEVLGCVGQSEVRVCATHRAISVCSCCGKAAACFGSDPTPSGQRRGIDYHPCYGALTEVAAAALGQRVRVVPGSRDQLHPLAVACLCGPCRKLAKNAGSAKVLRVQRAEAQVAAESARVAAEELARRPHPGPVAAAASAQTARTLRSTHVPATARPARVGKVGARRTEMVSLLDISLLGMLL
jgi:hypothetical protein